MGKRGLNSAVPMTMGCLLVFLSSCEPFGGIFPERLNSITVIVKDNIAYPIFQFRCSDIEETGTSDDCPEGFGCDGRHYHGTALSIGRVTRVGVSEVQVDLTRNTVDPDSCHCGWGKVGEADVRTLSIFKINVDDFLRVFRNGRSGILETTADMTEAEQMSVDPCGG